MTVTYTAEVNTSRLVSNFLRLLGRWRGSIYKLIWMDLLIFLTLYLLLALSYRFLMNEDTRGKFEVLVLFCNTQGAFIPLSFVLGFYVRIVMGRWWAQYTTIPWPDAIAILVSASIQGLDDRARAMRRTIMRYVCLCQLIVFTMISSNVKKRFPNYTTIIEAGLMQESERDIIENLDTAFPYYPKHWMPIVWAATIVTRARKENKIRDDYAVKSIIDELNLFRGLCGFLLYYDWVSVPLVYTQVVTVACYAFFACCLIGQQWVENPNSPTHDNTIDQYFPIMTVLQFFFFMGWLKVAESLINPFGENDDDFELNWMIDRNLAVCYLIVDEMHQEYPQLVKDQYWDEVMPNPEETWRWPEASTAKLIQQGMSSKIVPSVKVLYAGKMGNSYFRDSSTTFISHSSSASNHMRFTRLDMSDSEDLSKPHRPTSLNWEELIEQRKKERHERLRNRFLSLQSQQKPATNSRYIMTVLRPPSNQISEPTLPVSVEEEDQQESSGSSKKQEKTD